MTYILLIAAAILIAMFARHLIRTERKFQRLREIQRAKWRAQILRTENGAK